MSARASAAPGLRVVPPARNGPFPPTLPDSIALVGRDGDVERVRAAIDAETRLVSIVGPGGVGKTRLAAEVGHQVWSGAGGSVLFVSLTFVTEADRVPEAIAAAAGWELADGAPAVSQLARRLDGAATLIVLDNCEQIDALGELVAELVDAWPTTSLLATSRRTLGLAREQVVALEPLPLPRPDDPWREIAANPAVTALVGMVARRTPNYTVTRQNASALAELCVRLDGLPLAIELAAARLHLFSPTELLDVLDRRFDVLHVEAPDWAPHHRRLWAAIDWSYQLLGADTQRHFRHLATFADGFTLDAAAHVLAIDKVAALEAITLLNEHHLVRSAGERVGASRFEMLESMREFARAEMAARGELAAAEAAHAAWATEAAQALHPRIYTSDQSQVIASFDAERANFRAALRWQIDHANPGALRLGHGQSAYWLIRGTAREGLTWLHAALECAGSGTHDAVAKALLATGNLHHSLGELVAARDVLERAADAFQALGDRLRTAAAWHTLASIARELGDLDRAAQLEGDALEIYIDLELPRDQGVALSGLGVIAHRRGDTEQALVHLLRAVELFESCGDRSGVASTLDRIGLAHQQLGDPDAAVDVHLRAQAIAEEVGDSPTAVNAMVNVAEALIAAGDVDSAADTHAQIAEIAGQVGDARIGAHAHRLAGAIADSRGAVGGALGEHLDALAGFAAAGYALETVESVEQLAVLAEELDGGELVAECLTVAAAGRAATGTTPSRRVAELAQALGVAPAPAPSAGAGEWIVAALALVDELRPFALAHCAAQRPSAESDPLCQLGLTPREAEVARLLDGRRTDREIAEHMFVAVRTASTHVSAVLRKLGVASRRDVSARLAELGLAN